MRGGNDSEGSADGARLSLLKRWSTFLPSDRAPLAHEPFRWDADGLEKLFGVFKRGVCMGLFTSKAIALMSQVNSKLRAAVRDEFRLKQTKMAEEVYAAFRRNGASSGVEGTSGSLNASTLVKIFECLPGGIYGKGFFDCGSGFGQVVLAASRMGAERASGLDLEANLEIYSRQFHAAKKSLGMNDAAANIGFGDLSKMTNIPHNPDIVFTFWDSITPDSRENILKMTAQSKSARLFACTNAINESPELVLSSLNKGCPESWEFLKPFSTMAQGGAMQRQVWIFRRSSPLPRNVPCEAAVDFSSDLAVNLLLSETRRRGSSSTICPADYLPAAEALGREGFSCFKLLGRGGFGCVIHASWKGKPCVVKISVRSCESKKDDSLYREAEILHQGVHMLPRHPILPKPCLWLNGSALANLNLGPEKSASMLCMEACYGDCDFLRKRFQEEAKKNGVLSADCRLFFRSTLEVVSVAHTVLRLAHRDLKWPNLLLRGKWEEGMDFEIVLGDSGIAFLETKNRQYLENHLEISRNLGSNRALAARNRARGQQPPKPVLEPVSKDLQNKIMCSKGDFAHILKILSSGSVGYRPEDPQVAMGKRKIRDQETAASLEYAQAHDVYSVACMMLEIHQDRNGAQWASSKCPSTAWEKSIHNLHSKVDIMGFLRSASSTCALESSDFQNLDQEANLLHGMLKKDFMDRISAEEAGKHDYLTLVFLSKEQEALAAGDGICCPGGIPPWAAEGLARRYRRVGLTPVPELRIKRLEGKRGFGVFCQQPAKEHDLLTYYAGRIRSDGKFLFSKHVYPTETFHRYIDGFYGSGAWKVERLTEERSVGSVINSSRSEGGIHSPGNCYVEWDKYIIDSKGNIRIPVRARRPLEEGEELGYDYAFNSGHHGAFRRDSD